MSGHSICRKSAATNWEELPWVPTSLGLLLMAFGQLAVVTSLALILLLLCVSQCLFPVHHYQSPLFHFSPPPLFSATSYPMLEEDKRRTRQHDFLQIRNKVAAAQAPKHVYQYD